MKVVAGEFRGRQLSLPKGPKIRPTSQKVKEALFSILGAQVSGVAFLDLFAGCGNIGIEALSRGADSVVLVESSRFCIKAIAKNLDYLGLRYDYGLSKQGGDSGFSAFILGLEAEQALKLLYRKKAKFDLIFLDPPYRQEELKNCLLNLKSYDILRPQSLVIAEHSADETLPHLIANLRLTLTKQYGDSALSFYERQGK